MSVSPAGVWSTCLSEAEDLFANSSDFQTWVSENDAASAKDHIYLVGVSKPGITRPYIRISQGEWQADRVAGGARGHYDYSGSFIVKFEASITAAYVSGFEDAEFEFTNPVGNIIQDVLNLAGSDGYLPLSGFRKLEGPSHTSERNDGSLGNLYKSKFEFFWTH